MTTRAPARERRRVFAEWVRFYVSDVDAAPIMEWLTSDTGKTAEQIVALIGGVKTPKGLGETQWMAVRYLAGLYLKLNEWLAQRGHRTSHGI